MTKQIIAFDLDDVLADATDFWRLKTNQHTGLDLKAEHFKVPGDYWGYYESVWREHKVDHLMSEYDVDGQIINDQSQILAHKGSLNVLHELSEVYELVIVTARGGKQVPETDRWIQDVFPDIFSQVVYAHGKAGLANKNKGQICKEIGALYLVDDNPSHCQNAVENGVTAVLFGDYGWHTEVPVGLIRCRDWAAVLEYFNAQR